MVRALCLLSVQLSPLHVQMIKALPGTWLFRFISPTGKDAWSGRLPETNSRATDGPFASFKHARAVLENRTRCALHAIVVVSQIQGMRGIPLTSCGRAALSSDQHRRYVIYIAAGRGKWEPYVCGLTSAPSTGVSHFVEQALLHFPQPTRDHMTRTLNSLGYQTVQVRRACLRLGSYEWLIA